MTIPDASRSLGLDAPAVRDLIKSGFIANTQEIGKRTFVSSTEIESLANLPLVEAPHPACVVIRLGIYKEADDRAWFGYKKIDETDPKQLAAHKEAIRGYYRLPSTTTGSTVVFTFRSFVVGVYTLGEVDDEVFDRRRFKLEPPTKAAAKAFEGHRLITTRGGVVVHLDEDQGSSRNL